jgi:hypothetical protein
MQKQNLLKERNGASSKPETHTPSSALDIPVVVIDRMTSLSAMTTGSAKAATSAAEAAECMAFNRRPEGLLHPVGAKVVHVKQIPHPLAALGDSE